MRILYVPKIGTGSLCFEMILTQNLCDLAMHSGHINAIVAPETAGFHHASLYPCGKEDFGIKLFQKERDPGKTVEEGFYAEHLLDYKRLKEDIRAIEAAIVHFNPDLIIEINRPAAVISARRYQISCWSVVHAAMYRNRPFPRECLNDLNRILEEKDLTPILRYSDLFKLCERRISFAPIEIQPFTDLADVTRIGGMSLFPVQRETRKHISIFLNRSRFSSRALRKMITEAFKGAPYEVYASLDACATINEDNLHFTAIPKLQTLDGADAIIHDGNEFIYNQCLMQGIPQLIISDGTWRRSWNGNSAARNGFGIVLSENVLSMASLYEQFRRLRSDDWYTIRAKNMQAKVDELGDLGRFIQYINLNTPTL